MTANNIHLVIGAILTMIASFMAVVEQNIAVANGFFVASNFLLLYYAIASILEFCRYLLKLADGTCDEIE